MFLGLSRSIFRISFLKGGGAAPEAKLSLTFRHSSFSAMKAPTGAPRHGPTLTSKVSWLFCERVT